MEKRVFEIQVQNNEKLRDTIQKKVLKQQLSQDSFSASFMTEPNHDHSGVWDDASIPDERDWRKELASMKQMVGEFNINNYVKKVLDKEEQISYNRICAKMPEFCRVYMQYSLRKQFKQIKDSYEKWLEQCLKTEGDLDLPDIQVKVPRDEAETSVVHDEW